MRNKALKYLNSILYFVSTMLLTSGLVLAYRFEGPGLKGATLLGFTKHSWEEAHFVLALSTATLVISHIALNWGWIVKVATGGMRSRLIGALVVGALLLLIPMLTPLSLPLPIPEWGLFRLLNCTVLNSVVLLDELSILETIESPKHLLKSQGSRVKKLKELMEAIGVLDSTDALRKRLEGIPARPYALEPAQVIPVCEQLS